MDLFGIIKVTPVHFVAVPLFAAFLLPLAAKLSKVFIKVIPGLVFLYLTAISMVMFPAALNQPIVEIIAGWKPPLGINLYYGPLGGFLATIFALIGLLVWLYSLRFMTQEPLDRYYMLFMLLIAGAIGIVLTGDIFNLFVFMEITAITAYSLTAFLRGQDGAEAAFKYILMGSLSSTFILLGILILYTQTGTLNMADMSVQLKTVPLHIKATVMVLFLVGFGIEAEIFPLNGWAPDVYSQSPNPIGAIFGGVVVKAAVYALIRIVFTIFDLPGVYTILVTLGLITLVVAELSALRQKQIKRMLAYSSIGQMGLVLIAFGLGSLEGAYSALFQMLNHAIIKPMLFLAAGYLLLHSKDSTLSDLDGMGKKKPFAAFIFSLGALAIIGLPPFNGFWGKFYLLNAVAIKGNYFLIFALLGAAVVESVYYLRLIGRMYLKESTSETQSTPWSAVLVLLVFAASIMVIGFYPSIVHQYLDLAARELTDKAQYIQNVLTLK